MDQELTTQVTNSTDALVSQEGGNESADGEAENTTAQETIIVTPVTIKEGAVVGTVTFLVQDLSPYGKSAKFTYTVNFRDPLPEEVESEDAKNPIDTQVASIDP